MQKLFIFFILAIVYGSLYPFEFSFVDGPTDQWDKLLNSFYPFGGLGDVLGNIVLFVPFGFLGFEVISKSGKDKITYIKLFCWGFALALALQVIQIYIPFRTPSISDIYWNELGIALGIVSALVIESRYPKLSLSKVHNIPTILALFWLGYLLFPFIPTLDVQQIKDSLKQVILHPEFNFDDLVFLTTAWLSFAYFTNNLFSHPFINRYRLPLFVITTLLVRVNIFSNHLELADVLAGLLAISIWYMVLGKYGKVNKVLCFLLIVTILINGRGPLGFSWNTGFSWIPFSGFLQGSIYENSRTIFYKIFLYGSLLWLVKESFSTIKFTTLYCFSMICTIEILQIFMVSHNAEITDGLLILLLSRVIQIPKEPFKTSQTPLNITDTVSGNKINESQLSHTNEIPTVQTSKSLKPVIIGKTLIAILIGLFLFIGGGWIVTHSSLVPYNIRELVNQSHPLLSLFLIACFLYCCFSFPVWIANRLTNIWWKAWLYPGMVLLHLMLMWLFLRDSVPAESIHDILGSPILGWPWELEYIGRFAALFGILSLALVGSAIFVFVLCKKKDVPVLWYWIASVALLAPICHFIVVKKAATDNLTELMAAGGSVVSSFLLFSYCVMVSLAGSLLSIQLAKVTRYQRMIGIIYIIISYPFAYLVIAQGTEKVVSKYGQTFSALQFLLSIDRTNLVQGFELFVRYAVFHTAAILAVALVQSPLWLLLLDTRNRLRSKVVPDSRCTSSELNIARESLPEDIRKARIKRKKSVPDRSQTGIKLDISKRSDPVSRKESSVKWTKVSIRFRQNQIRFLKGFSNQKEISVSRAVRSMIAGFMKNEDSLKTRLAQKHRFRSSRARSASKESRIINLHADQLVFLNTLAHQMRISVSKLVRMILDDFKNAR